jgi:hypothetical protein
MVALIIASHVPTPLKNSQKFFNSPVLHLFPKFYFCGHSKTASRADDFQHQKFKILNSSFP